VHVTPICRIPSTAVLLFALGAVVAAQERHLDRVSTGVLFARSAFAHGYIHGYEEGFHSGDMDLQYGRGMRDPASLAPYKHPCAAYRESFGSKKLFKSGFEDGFRAGYSDAVHEEKFHAVESLRNVADRITATPKDATAFDDGFRNGYDTGRRQGADDGRNLSVANPINPPCLGLPEVYCDAFARGFQVGYTDGYHNQSNKDSPPAKLQASAK
jgi:flagellar biosynthesis/type III secretory pathway protein FliH